MEAKHEWRSVAEEAIRETLSDRVLAKLLSRSNLTKTQFETILVDQLGSDMANKTLTREEMTWLRANRDKISRGSFNRTLEQARTNVAKSVHTVLLLGYCGLLESPSLAPLLEASERLRSQTSQLREAAQSDPDAYSKLVESLLEDLETAFDALRGKARDT
jgi:hypothetical protein